VDNTAWKLAKQVFQEALEETGRERLKFVEEACGDDAELLAQVTSLLQAHDEAGDFLSESSLTSGFLQSSALLEEVGFGDLPGPLPDRIEGGQDDGAEEGLPALIGPYEVLGVLGVGGMGTVYRARDPDLARELAIKVLPDDFVSSTQLARFEREARLLASLNHPNIATIHAIGETDGRPYLVLELIEGESLSQHLTGGPLPVEEAIDLGRQVAEAIEAAHEAGIVHRDLKPANVMITARGLVKILDFGIAKVAGPGAPAPEGMEITSHGTLLGTIPYMSPEQIGGKEIDERSDLWALGCVLYETLTGTSPFDRTTSALTFVAIQKEEPDLTALPKGTPEGLRQLIAGCLDKDPDGRPDSATVALRSLSDTLTGLRGPPTGAWSQLTPLGRGAWVAVGVLATIAVLAVAEERVVQAFIDLLPRGALAAVTDGGRLAALAAVALAVALFVLRGRGSVRGRRRIRIAAYCLVTVTGLALVSPVGGPVTDQFEALTSGAMDVYVSLPFRGADDEDLDELLEISIRYRETFADVFGEIESVRIMPADYNRMALGASSPQCTYKQAKSWLPDGWGGPDLVLCNYVNMALDPAGRMSYKVVTSLQKAHDQELEFVDRIMPPPASKEEVKFQALWASAQIVRTLGQEQFLVLGRDDEKAVLEKILFEYSTFLSLQGDTASEVARLVDGLRTTGPGEGLSHVQQVIDVLKDYEPAVSFDEDGARHRRIRDATLGRMVGSK